MSLTSALTLPSKPLTIKTFAVTTAMTAGTDKAFVVPKNGRIIGFVLSGTASNAGTTATLSIGTTSGTPTEYVNGANVLAAGVGNGVNLLSGVAGAVGGKLTKDTIIYVKYAETGAASN
ncbi:MAG TPA: hypothetical protein VIY48_13745, partial [Candidatus Paceibacterota bacterium]